MADRSGGDVAVISNSKSEPDLTTTGKCPWGNAGFPPGVTVDELCFYRKRRAAGDQRPIDNLRPEQGSLKNIISEYTRRFRDFSPLGGSCGNLTTEEKLEQRFGRRIQPLPSCLKLEGPLSFNPEYREVFIEYPIERLLPMRPKQSIPNPEGPMELLSEQHEKYVPLQGERAVATKRSTSLQREGNFLGVSSECHSQFVGFDKAKKSEIVRHPTSLSLEGQMYTTTEKAEQFVRYLIDKRAELVRTPTHLKLEGDMLTQTENQEKYIPFDVRRSPLRKRDTMLHLEGEMDTQTEKRLKYVPYELQKRPPLAKRDTNLRLEGDLSLIPEYTDVFRVYPSEKPAHPFPQNNLKSEGDIDMKTENATKFITHGYQFVRSSPKRPNLHLEGKLDLRPEYKENYVRHRGEKTVMKKPKENLKLEGAIDAVSESQTKFVEPVLSKGTEVTKPASHLKMEGTLDMNPEYKNMFVDFSKRPKSKSRLDRKKVTGHLKPEGEIETNPEYKSAFVDFPRTRPQVKKPESQLKNEGETEHITEKEAQYVQHKDVVRTWPSRRPSTLKLEGDLECQPEYRKAYTNYLIREYPVRSPVPPDSLNFQDEKKAFQVLCTQGTEAEAKRLQMKDKRDILPVQPDTRFPKHNIPKTRKQPQEIKLLKPDSSAHRRTSSIFGTKCMNSPVISDVPSRGGSRTNSPFSKSLPRMRDGRQIMNNSSLKGIKLYDHLNNLKTAPPEPERKWIHKSRRDETLNTSTECNNNVKGVEKPTSKGSKWMPSWYEPAF